MGFSVKALARAVVGELRGCTDMVRRLIGEARDLSEHEVLAAGRCVVSINNEAKQHATDLDELARQFASGSTENRRNIAQVIHRQTETCSNFADEMGEKLRDQAELAMRALELTKSIARFGDQITRISMEARILTLNADIESKRLGKAGAAFGAIAGEMRHLSASVHSTNQAVAQLAGDLTRILPKLAASSHEMLRHSESFSEQLVRQLADVQGAYDAAQQSVTEALSEGQQRAERIFSQTCEVLSHLQFQDRMAQDLTKAMHQLDVATRVVETALTDLPETAESNGKTDVGRAFDRAREHAPSVVHMLAEALPEAPGHTMLQAGDIELF